MPHYISVPITCPRCGTIGTEHWCAGVTPLGLRTSNGFRCECCGCGHEGDGDQIPDDVREAFVLAEGLWTLAVVALGARPLGSIRIVRERTSTSPSEALRMVREREIIIRATLAEVEQLRMLLEREGAQVLVRRCGQGPRPPTRS